jgi:Protein of unknown function (DUF4242)
MPLYAIRRNVGPISREELDAAGFRAVVCAAEYDGLHWERSFWNPAREELICYYVAKSADEIRRHSHQSNIPCDDVSEVTEMLPHVYSPAVPARS